MKLLSTLKTWLKPTHAQGRHEQLPSLHANELFNIAKCNVELNDAVGNKEQLAMQAQKLRDILAEQPDDAACHYLLGAYCQELCDFQGQIHHWRRAAQLEPDAREYLYALGIAMHMRDRTQPDYAQVMAQCAALTRGAKHTLAQDEMSAGAVINALNTYGFVILKNAVKKEPTEKLVHALQRNLANATSLADYNESAYDSILPIFFFSDVLTPELLNDRIREGREQQNKNWFRLSLVKPKDMTLLKKALLDQVTSGMLAKVFTHMVGHSKWGMHPDYCMIRTTSAAGYKKGGFAGFHQDGRLQGRFDRFVTIWYPLVEVGKNNPTIAAVPAAFRQFYPYNRDGSADMISYRDFPPEFVVRAQMEPGDIWLHMPLALHGTVVEPDMDAQRYSVDVRVF